MTRKMLLLAATLVAFVAADLSAQSTLQLTGILRDFKRGDQTGGHPDFETCQTVPGHGVYGLVPGLVTMGLDSAGKPVYNPNRPGNDSIQSAESFSSWFRDVPGTNLAAPHTLVLSGDAGGIYTYQTTAFFPIDGQLYGNQNQKDASGKVHNFSFTFELHNKFSYRPGQKFTFIGDDDVWVYVNGAKVIDLGGVHGAQTGSVLLLDSKAFVSKTAFPVAGIVKGVSASYLNVLRANWSQLGLPGTCPIAAGDPYIDLNLNGGHPDVACAFTRTSVAIRSVSSLTSVVLKFVDNTVQRFDLGEGCNITLAGTGAWAGKDVVGCWIRTVDTPAGGGYGLWFGADGSSGAPEASLDFFFAERHVTESRFRIDTSINLKPKPLTTISPTYD